jgi:hypothetical protein
MYNLRYHIASLVAVFLALSVGLLLGTVVAPAQTTTKNLVASLKQSFDTLSGQNDVLNADNTALSAFATQAEPHLVGNVLLGRTVMVIADPDSSDAVARVSDAVSAAGGLPAVATLEAADLSLSDPTVSAAATAVLGPTEPSQLTSSVVEALVREWTTAGDPRKLTAALVDAGALKMQDLPASATVSGCAVAAVFDKTPDAAGIALARGLASAGRLSAGVETTKLDTGMASAATAAGLSAVDDVDSPLGQVSLVWVLSGRAGGWFGELPRADSRFPEPLFPAQ